MEFNKLPRHRQDYYNQHSVPTTRRDFLSLGLIGVGAATFINPLDLLAKQINFENLDTSSDIATIVIDLAGGAGLSANFLVGNKGGAKDLLKSYSTLGWDPKNDGYISDFGAPMAKEEISGITKGIFSKADSDAIKNFKMGTLLHNSDDDTSSNPLSIAGLVYANSSSKHHISKIIGARSSRSGGNSSLANEIKSVPIFFNNIESLNSLVGAKHSLGDNLSGTNKIFSLLKRVSNRQINSLSSEDQLLIKRSYEKANDLATLDVNLDPRLDEDSKNVFGINEDTNEKDRGLIKATIAYNTIVGNSGPGVITIGGCDYHDNTSTTGDAKDLEIGELIGQVVQLAKLKNKKLYIQVISDGSVDSLAGTRIWRGDSGERSMSVIGYFDPDGKSNLLDKTKSQIGFYNNTQTADRSSLIGASPRLASYAAYANYLSITNQSDKLEVYLGNVFTRDEVKSVLLF
jgi:hypothetical protein